MMPVQERIIASLKLLQEATKDLPPTLTMALIKDFGRDPYLILISCLLSLRARDTMTYPVSKKLFNLVKTPKEMVLVPLKDLEQLFYPLGFFRTKAMRVKEVSKDLLERFAGQVPRTQKELLSIKGIGRKTANLVLACAFDIPAICVDTHVHRIANRLGWVTTKTPDETERELMKIVPQNLWIELNTYLVQWGQNVCTPRSPRCSSCVLNPLCPKIGVTTRR